MLLDTQLQAHHRERLGHVLEAGDHLLRLINQILDISGIESGQQHVATQAVALAPLLESCVALCDPLAEAAAVTLRPVQPLSDASGLSGLRVLGDPTRLRQVLINLLSNAIKYNRPQGSVHMVVRLASTGDGGPEVLLDIADTGIGLDPVQLERLFEPFNRVGAERTRIEGHGIGLAYARALARAMGGDITVTSQPGEGTCFTLHLHLAPDDSEVAPPLTDLG
jgi:signal transduction histidine kinase